MSPSLRYHPGQKAATRPPPTNAVGLFRPHIPWEVPQRWFDLYRLDEVQLPEYREDDLDDAHNHGRRNWHKWVTDNKQWHHLMQGYLASINVTHFQNVPLDGDAIQTWLGEHCREFPEKPFGSAVHAFASFYTK